MKGRLFTFLVFALFLLAAAGSVHAQTATTGQVVGTVKDPSGAVVEGVKVTLASPAGGG